MAENFIQYLLNRWIGRARFIFQYLIQNILQNFIDKKENIFYDEPKMFLDAVLKSHEYIKSYENCLINSGVEEKKISEILKYIYFDLVMKRKRKNFTTLYSLAANLVQQGIMFLPSNLEKINFSLELVEEPISFNALDFYFQKKRLSGVDTNNIEEIENSFLKDPILEICYNDLLQFGESMPSRYIWEDCLCRFFMLSLRPTLKSTSIGYSSIMKSFVEIDYTLYFYSFEGVYVIDEDISENKFEFTHYLMLGNGLLVYYPNIYVGNDISFTILRLNFEDCMKISKFFNIKFDKNIFNSLPLTRNLTIQTKFLTKDQNIDNQTLIYASKTCLIENSYSGKNNENSNNRTDFKNNFLDKKIKINNIEILLSKNIVDWNIGIVCISGSLPKNFDEKVQKINENPHHLIGYITPLNFNFKGKLQEFLIYCCHLGDKSLKRKVDDLYNDNIDNITKEEDLMLLTLEQLEPIASKYKIEKKKDNKKNYVNKIAESIKKKKIENN